MKPTVAKEVRKVAEGLRHKNLIKDYPSFVAKNGIPLWDKVKFKTVKNNNTAKSAFVEEADEKGIFVIPLENDQVNEVTSYITCEKSNDSSFTYRLYNKEALQQVETPTEEKKKEIMKSLAVFGALEKEVNNKDTLVISSPYHAVIHNANVGFSTESSMASSSGNCTATFYMYVEWQLDVYSIGNTVVAYSWYISASLDIVITCNGDEPGGGNGSGPGDDNPWYYDPNDDNNPWHNGLGWPTNVLTDYDPNTWYPWWLSGGVSAVNTQSMLSYLSSTNGLSINSSQRAWLINHSDRLNELYNYLLTSTDANKKEKAEDHLQEMMSNSDYLNFVENHSQTSSSDDMWWEDDNWLDNAANFSFDIDGTLNQFKKLNPQEKVLTALFPIQAFIMNRNRTNAWQMSWQKFPNNTTHIGENDRKNAFLHAYFNAINTRDVPAQFGLTSAQIVLAFANAHESDTPQQLDLEKQMDTFNNGVGINLCIACLPLLSSDSFIADGIMSKLHNGELRYLDPLDWTLSPSYQSGCATCSNGIILITRLIPTN